MDWKFLDSKDTMVITTKQILKNNAKITLVSHDKEDGMWQFLDSNDLNVNNAQIVSIEEIVNIDKSLMNLNNLPLGWFAVRDKNDN